jgi:hypothetical protein
MVIRADPSIKKQAEYAEAAGRWWIIIYPVLRKKWLNEYWRLI